MSAATDLPDPLSPDDSTCPNCGATEAGRYCRDCGQKRPRPGDLSLAHAWRHLVDEVLDVDGRIFRTMRLLFTKPGQLTVDFFSGRRARYVHPLRLFLVVSGLYFLAETQTLSPSGLLRGRPGQEAAAAVRAAAASGGEPYPVRLAGVEAQVRLVFKITFIGTVLINGLWFWVLFRTSRPYLAEHMITALHLSAFAMIVTMVGSWLARRLSDPVWLGGIIGAIPQVYLAMSLNRVYPDRKFATIVAVVTVILIDVALLVGVSMLALRRAAGLPLI